MFINFGGGQRCFQCREMFEFIPLDTAKKLGRVPANAWLSPAADVMPEQLRAGEPFWVGDAWPSICAQCDPEGWLVPVFPAGSSFFRS